MINAIEFKNIVKKPTPTNHVFVLDCSGSMYGTINKMKEHLKQNISLLIKPEDTISLLYFASRGQFGTVFAGQKINSIEEVEEIRNSIDRYVRVMGCTGFVEPLQLAIDTVKTINNGNLNSLIFMTDGYDNQWREEEILKICEKLPLSFSDITFLEYGWYCNRQLLEKMTDATSANHVFAESYSDYEPVLENALQSIKTNRKEIDIDESTTHIVYCDGEKIVVNRTEGKKAFIPEHISTVYTIDDNLINDIVNISDEQLLYVSLYFAVHTMNPELVWKVLSVLGDVKIINMYNNCFSKQDKSNLKEFVTQCVFDNDSRFINGRNCDLVPDNNAYNIVDLINDLVEGDSKINTNSDDFEYSRIGRKSVQKDDDTIDLLTEQIANEPDKEKRKELAKQLMDAQEWTPSFEPTGSGIVDMTNLISHESRPNLSIQTCQSGIINVPEEIQNKYKLPSEIETFRWRNYNIVKDGIVNMKKLPVIVNKATLNKINSHSVEFIFTEGNDYHSEDGGRHDKKGMYHITIDLADLPLINRSMIKNLRAKDYATDQVNLEILKASQKVFNHYYKQLDPLAKSKGFLDLYGETTTAYLSEKGIRDYGFSPKVTREPSTDVYMTIELNTKIKGASSLPSVNAVLKKIEEGKKLNTADLMMKKALDYYNSFIESPVIVDSLVKDSLILTWLKSETENAIKKTRELNKEVSKKMYGIVVGHTWFTDSDNDVDEPQETLKIESDIGTVEVTLLMEEKEEKI